MKLPQKPKSWDRDLLISLASLVVALASIAFAFQANQRADEANQLAREANELSRDANKIALVDVNANVSSSQGETTKSVHVYGCQYEFDENTYYVYSRTSLFMTFTNSGGRPVSLLRVSLSGDDREWSTKIYDSNRKETALPIDLPANVSRIWTFVAKSVSFGLPESDATQLFDKRLNAYPILNWKFQFGDNKTLAWRTQTYPTSAGLNDFEEDCASIDNRSAPVKIHP